MSDPRRDTLIAAARSKLGIPYGLPPSPPATTDCSYWFGDVCQAAGFPVPNWLHPTRTAEQIRAALLPVAFDAVLPGDALFFEHTYEPSEASAVGDGHVASHIGMSLGAGSHRMLNAVEPVSKESDIGTAYWQDKILSAGRLPQLAAATTSPGGTVTVPTMPRGVDVASYQGRPDWAAVAASGIAFAITKVSEDDDYTNPTFAYNWQGIKDAGLIRGGYHFARPDGAVDAVQEADYFLGRINSVGGLAAGDLLALDLEAGSGDLGQWALDWLRHVESRVGFKPLVYSGKWFTDAHNIAAYPELGQYGLWLAAYQGSMPVAPAPWQWVSIWQYTDKGSVPGISGNVDLSMFNGPADRITLYGKPSMGTPPIDTPAPPVPAPQPSQRDRLIAIRDELSALIDATAA